MTRCHSESLHDSLSCVVQPSADGAALTGRLMEDTTARWRSVMVVFEAAVSAEQRGYIGLDDIVLLNYPCCKYLSESSLTFSSAHDKVPHFTRLGDVEVNAGQNATFQCVATGRAAKTDPFTMEVRQRWRWREREVERQGGGERGRWKDRGSRREGEVERQGGGERGRWREREVERRR
ncbi:hypothetical protein NFI96_006490 [Prochilodus magdalenae]|nr:hypothetical protein NFI96_006490 [Prochilodus magdalenae]